MNISFNLFKQQFNSAYALPVPRSQVLYSLQCTTLCNYIANAITTLWLHYNSQLCFWFVDTFLGFTRNNKLDPQKHKHEVLDFV